MCACVFVCARVCLCARARYQVSNVAYIILTLLQLSALPHAITTTATTTTHFPFAECICAFIYTRVGFNRFRRAAFNLMMPAGKRSLVVESAKPCERPLRGANLGHTLFCTPCCRANIRASERARESQMGPLIIHASKILERSSTNVYTV